MKVFVTIDALGCSEEAEIDISDPSMIDWEVERFVHDQVSYDYEVIEEEEDEE
ncbi:hypothetical protein [Bacillus thuringiensis]|uniref:hypothetical protein n=1 Tax=Bacillus thuringiensis TaxID=1428 RepID=UPI0026E28265|nr:hypothetical protein [Bacillus thuringiensis]MDO6634314.1 hypothetical protein [Bacillus thuringiensis]MDO6663583.1 hypothetical protein [Bacillus thuringiensis]MDO6704454.1 hypothetical protein [Bacillus thuringiensis]